MKSYTKKLTDDQKKDLKHRLHNHAWVNETAVVVLTAAELQVLLDHIATLEKLVESYARYAENINQSLNEGDGTYKP